MNGEESELNWLGILAAVLLSLGLVTGLISFAWVGAELLGMAGLLVGGSVTAAILAVIDGI